MPVNSLPLTESVPWNGQSLSSHDLRGETTETPIFLTINYHITHFLIARYTILRSSYQCGTTYKASARMSLKLDLFCYLFCSLPYDGVSPYGYHIFCFKHNRAAHTSKRGISAY